MSYHFTINSAFDVIYVYCTCILEILHNDGHFFLASLPSTAFSEDTGHRYSIHDRNWKTLQIRS